MATEQTHEIEVRKRGTAGVITLNRPQALNALNRSMIRQMTEALRTFREDDDVQLVIVTASGDRAFCAGGDIAELYDDAKNQGSAGARFWADEYRLDLMIAHYPKPYIPIMRGIVLGGGVGISAHGSHRVVTDTVKIGMPETGIGYFPDVGATKLLAQAPYNVGKHLALTAGTIGAAEAIASGLADFFVPDQKFSDLLDRLVDTGDVATIAEFQQSPPEAFGGALDDMEKAYSPSAVGEILANLDDHDSTWAADAANRIRRNCPLSLHVALQALQRHRDLELQEVLKEEFSMSLNAQRNPNFVEGVRAQIIDKDRNPQWQPATWKEVTADDVAGYFAPLTDPELIDLQQQITLH